MRRSIRPSTWDLRVGRSTASRHRSGPRRPSRSGRRSRAARSVRPCHCRVRCGSLPRPRPEDTSARLKGEARGIASDRGLDRGAQDERGRTPMDSLRSSTLIRPVCMAAILLGLSACGGGGGSGGGSGGPPGGGNGWVMGVYPPSAHFAAQCQSPRSGTDPVTGRPYPDVQGTTLDENNWLRSWTNELYLWYREVPDVDPATYSATANCFAILKTSATTSTGHPKDRFHFTYLTAQWEQLSQAGVDIGYGVTWDLQVPAPPRQVYAAYVWPGYAAAAANIMRGAKILNVDGVDMIKASDSASLNTLNQGLFPSNAGESHTFTLQDQGSSTSRMVALQTQTVTETPVPIVTTIPTPTGPVGYILFNRHIATAEAELYNAINQLHAANVTDLVLDLRYNGGGFLDIASELAYMIAGPGPTAGATFA